MLSERDKDVLKQRLARRDYNRVGEDDLITPRDLEALLAENARLRAESAAVMDDYKACMGERDRMRAALKPFVAFGKAYPRPRIAVSAEDTVLVSSRDCHITLADVDRAAAALEQKSDDVNRYDPPLEGHCGQS